MSTQKPGSPINTQRPNQSKDPRSTQQLGGTGKDTRELGGKNHDPRKEQQFAGNKGQTAGKPNPNQTKGGTPKTGSNIWDTEATKRAAEAKRIEAQRSNTSTGQNIRPEDRRPGGSNR